MTFLELACHISFDAGISLHGYWFVTIRGGQLSEKGLGYSWFHSLEALDDGFIPVECVFF